MVLGFEFKADDFGFNLHLKSVDDYQSKASMLVGNDMCKNRHSRSKPQTLSVLAGRCLREHWVVEDEKGEQGGDKEQQAPHDHDPHGSEQQETGPGREIQAPSCKIQ